ncbi:biopolymer transporter ExbD [uncultured Campylobacter sp.]|jgi:biopolymer transport protein, exbD/tolR family|uniref:biopolymer transporter ExbD n=1 Tax=uncultured Campylobacter sp. TaxID=218934 RepID=UPI0026025E5C|nr:biopolymer transporter ExbD [uncultured Campylobacter sp.]
MLRNQNEELSEINVTPFIDVMLVLLIIFMVVTPIVTSSVKVELPKAVSDQKQDINKPIILSINEHNEIYFGTELVGSENLAAVLDQKTGGDRENVVYLHVDKSVPYEILIGTIERIKKAGYSKIALCSKVEQ